MKQTKTNKFVTCLFAVAFMSMITGCAKEGIYDPTSGTAQLPPVDDYFDFKLTGDVQLSVNYDVAGLSTIIEVYDQDPMLDHKTKKEGINPIFAAYTIDGKYEGTMNIPTAVKEAYLYSKSIVTPTCLKLTATTSGFAFDGTEQNGTKTRVNALSGTPVGLYNSTRLPYEVAAKQGGQRPDNLYSIATWNVAGWALSPANYYNRLWNIGEENESIGNVVARIDAFLYAQRDKDKNKSLLRTPEQINLKVPASATDGMQVEVSFMGEHCSFFNTFGYYYYEDKGITLTPQDFWKIKKYIITPNVKNHVYGGGTFGTVAVGETVKLLYFDENGNKSEKFPANYVIGWFLISNGYGKNPPEAGQGGYADGGNIQDLPADAYTSAAKYSDSRHSCMSDDQGNDRRFISLYDKKSKLRVIGIEDFTSKENEPDDYMDLMFVAKTTPDLGQGGLPPIGPEDPKPDPIVWSVSRTAAFEDIWPYGGDYDLNDVIVEYNRVITSGNDNIVTSIKEEFKPVQKAGSAANDNFFACQYANPGKLTLPAGVIYESATNSIVIEASAKTIAGSSYAIVRDMSGLGIKQEDAQKDFNPYIITGKYSTVDRVEVHLPMYEMTSAANKTLMNADNAYYISKDKIYPFAITIPISGFIPADETKRIDSEGQYPSFTKWVTSKGKENDDWYLRDKGKK